MSGSTQSGKLGFFFSGSQQSTDMRREPVLLDTTTNEVVNFHNHGDDMFGFAKVQYTPSANDVINLEGNLSQTRFQVPFDTAGGTIQNDRQRDFNSFLNLGWHHQFAGPAYSGGNAASATEAVVPELFFGLFYRAGSLR